MVVHLAQSVGNDRRLWLNVVRLCASIAHQIDTRLNAMLETDEYLQ